VISSRSGRSWTRRASTSAPVPSRRERRHIASGNASGPLPVRTVPGPSTLADHTGLHQRRGAALRRGSCPVRQDDQAANTEVGSQSPQRPGRRGTGADLLPTPRVPCTSPRSRIQARQRPPGKPATSLIAYIAAGRRSRPLLGGAGSTRSRGPEQRILSVEPYFAYQRSRRNVSAGQGTTVVGRVGLEPTADGL
jgi:hypothetical protein